MIKKILQLNKKIAIKILCFVFIFVVFFTLINSAKAASGINPQLNYQGKISDASGSPLEGNYNFKFEIYDASSGGTLLWTETWNSVSTQVVVTTGIFSVPLGSISSTDPTIFNNDSLYLQVYFDADSNGTFEEVFNPRKRLTSAPYAFNAGALNGFSATSTATANKILALDSNSGMVLNGVTTTNLYVGSNALISGNVQGSNAIFSGYVSSTALQINGNATATGNTYLANLTVGSLSGLLWGTNGVVTAVSTSSLGLGGGITEETDPIWLAASSSYLTTASATATYLSSASATATYLPLALASATYLSQLNAASTYLTIANASSTYLTITSAGETYLSIANWQGSEAYNITLASTTNWNTAYNAVTASSSQWIAFWNASNTVPYLSLANNFTATNTFAFVSSTGLKISGDANIIGNLTVGGITLGGQYQATWPVGSGGWWATSSNSLVGYPGLSGEYAIVIGSAVTTSNVKLEVVGATKLGGDLEITGILNSGNIVSSGYISSTALQINGSATTTGNLHVLGNLNVSETSTFTTISSNIISANEIWADAGVDLHFRPAGLGKVVFFDNSASSEVIIYGSVTTTGTLYSENIVLTNALSVAYGGTGTSTAPSYGQILVGNSSGGYSLLSTSSLGLGGGITEETDPIWLAASSSYLTTASATATYLSSASATATYLPLALASATYLSQLNAASTYLTIANASSTYLTITSAGETYLSIANWQGSEAYNITLASTTNWNTAYNAVTASSSQWIAFWNASNTVPYLSLANNFTATNTFAFVSSTGLQINGNGNITGNLIANAVSSTNITSTNIYLPFTNSFLASDANGKIVATSAPAGTGDSLWSTTSDGIYYNSKVGIGTTTSATYDVAIQGSLYVDELYTSGNSIYMNGQKILESGDTTLSFTADNNQNLAVKTSGNGNLTLGALGSGSVQLSGAYSSSTLTIANSGNITAQTYVENSDIVLNALGTNSDIAMSATRILLTAPTIKLNSYTGLLTANDGIITTTSASSLGLPTSASGLFGQIPVYTGSGNALAPTSTILLSSSKGVSLGSSTAAIGLGAIVGGLNSSVNGDGSVALGFYNSVADGVSGATALGYMSNAAGQAAVAMGRLVVATGTASMAFGQNITVTGANSVGIGLSAVSNTLTSSNHLVSQANVMAIMGGSVGIGKVSPATTLDVLGTVSSTALVVNGNVTISGIATIGALSGIMYASSGLVGTIATSSISHNHLGGLQGGTTNQYNHLTDAQVTALHSAVTISDTASVNLSLSGQQISAVVLPGGVDHNSLSGYNTNVHYLQTEISNVSSSLATGMLKVTTGSGLLSSVATTGSGNVVLATSPTLVTPTLGVASATSLNVGSSKFSIDSNGNIIKINNITSSWPSVQGGAGTVLTNNGSGTFSWATPATGGSGTVNSGVAGSFTYYPSDGTTVDDASDLTWDNTFKILKISPTDDTYGFLQVRRINSGGVMGTILATTTYIAHGENRMSSDGKSGANTYISGGGNGSGASYGGHAGSVEIAVGGDGDDGGGLGGDIYMAKGGNGSPYGNSGTVYIGNPYSPSNKGNLFVYGRVAIGTTTFATNTKYSLTLPNNMNTGYGVAWGWDSLSDDRIKTNQQPLNYGLDEILQLVPKRYMQHSSDIIDGKLVLTDDGKENIGLIAQEVYGIIPEAVSRPQDDSKSLWAISYDSLIPVMIKAIQELSVKNDDLKSQLSMTSNEDSSLINVIDSFASESIRIRENIILENLFVVMGASNFYGTITVVGEAGFKSKVTFEKEVEFKDHILVDEDTAGTAVIQKGSTSTKILFKKEYGITPKVVFNLQSSGTPIFTNYLLSNKSNLGFDIILENEAPIDLYFDWIALASKGTQSLIFISGCTDITAVNYDSLATMDDGTCNYETASENEPVTLVNVSSTEETMESEPVIPISIVSSTEETMENELVTPVNVSSTEEIIGCTDSEATNYDSSANLDDGSCTYEQIEESIVIVEEADAIETIITVD